MIVRYSPHFYRQYKKANVRIRNSVDARIAKFLKNANDLQLNNHALRDEWQGYRSIDITSDWRALYKEIFQGEDPTAYFVELGTHKELYRTQ